MEKARLFIAIELPSQTKSLLKIFRERLKGDEYIRWVEPENIHLTIKFLGDVALDKIPLVTDVLSCVAGRFSPFFLEIKDRGVFPGVKNVQVIWLGVGGDIEVLFKLWGMVEEGLAGIGFPPEGRKFVPHITLARVRGRAPRGWVEGFVKNFLSFEFEQFQPFEVKNLSLMRSQLTPSGPIYSRLSLFWLKI